MFPLRAPSTIKVVIATIVALSVGTGAVLTQGHVPVPFQAQGQTSPIVPSAGCGVAPPAGIVPAALSAPVAMTYPLAAVAPYTASVATPSLANRDYRVYLPAGYDPSVPYPLVVALHYFSGSSSKMALLTRLDDVADRLHVIVVYPDGTLGQAGYGSLSGASGWDTYDPGAWPGNSNAAWEGVDDNGFLNTVQQAMQALYCVNTDDVGVLGFSEGGGMTWHLLCDGVSWFRAAGIVAASMNTTHGFGSIGSSGCLSTHVGVMQFAGDNDALQGGGAAFLAYSSMNYYTGSAVYDTTHPLTPFTSLLGPFTTSAGANGTGVGCAAQPTVAYSNTEVFEQVYSGCAARTSGSGPNDSAFFSIPGGNHSFPGGYANILTPYGCTAPLPGVGGGISNNTTCQVDAATLLVRFLTTGSTAVDPASTPVPPNAPLH